MQVVQWIKKIKSWLINPLTSSFKKHYNQMTQCVVRIITGSTSVKCKRHISRLEQHVDPIQKEIRYNCRHVQWVHIDYNHQALFPVALPCNWPEMTFIQLSLQRPTHSILLGKWRITNIQRALWCHKYPASRWHSNKQTCPFMNKIIPSHRRGCSATWP